MRTAAAGTRNPWGNKAPAAAAPSPSMAPATTRTPAVIDG